MAFLGKIHFFGKILPFFHNFLFFVVSSKICIIMPVNQVWWRLDNYSPQKCQFRTKNCDFRGLKIVYFRHVHRDISQKLLGTLKWGKNWWIRCEILYKIGPTWFLTPWPSYCHNTKCGLRYLFRQTSIPKCHQITKNHQKYHQITTK